MVHLIYSSKGELDALVDLRLRLCLRGMYIPRRISVIFFFAKESNFRDCLLAFMLTKALVAMQLSSEEAIREK